MRCIHCNTELADDSKFCRECGRHPTETGSSPREPPPTSGGGVTNLHDMLQAELGDRYELGKLLGRGGMGAVFLATDQALDRAVAVKVLPPELAHDENFVGRFEREARTAAKLDHPGIIPIYAVEHSSVLYYFIMKYVTGRALDEVLGAGQMPIDTTQRIIWESAVALGHAHQRGVVHRDIKPANIMIDEAGRTVLMDFGISKASQAATQFTATGQVIGTPHYMSPEQAKGLQVDGRSDQYSLACVAYRMLSGQLPFADGSIHTVIYKHIFEDPEPVDTLRTDIPAFLATAVRRALAKDPNDRFSTMEEFASAVWPEQAVPGPSHALPIPAQSVSSTDAATQITPQTGAVEAGPAKPVANKRRGIAGVLAGLVVITAGGFGGWWAMTSENSPFATTVPDDSTGQELALASPIDSSDTPTVPDTTNRMSQDTAQEQAALTPATTPRQDPEPQTPSTPVQVPVTPPPQQPAAPLPGRLRVAVTADFGTVFIDGRRMQDTPTNFELQPGTYVLEIRREGYVTVTDTIEIVAGGEFRRRYPFGRQQ
jgi:serine/threonine protein kinase